AENEAAALAWRSRVFFSFDTASIVTVAGGQNARCRPADAEPPPRRRRHIISPHPRRRSPGIRMHLAAGSQFEHRRRRVLPSVLRARSVQPIIPPLDRWDTACIQAVVTGRLRRYRFVEERFEPVFPN